MNLRDFQYITAVADEGGFLRAAERVHVSQPTLSMQIKKLEDELGVTLFERGARQVLLTAEGKDIVERARRILQEVEAMRRSAQAHQDPFAGELRIGAFPTIAPYLLPLVIPKLHKRYPKLRLLLTEEKSALLLEQLTSGRQDAVILALPLEEEGLASMELMDDPFFLAVPPQHSLAKRARITVEEIAHEPLLLLEEGHCLRAQALEVCSRTGAVDGQDFRATSLETLRQMVAAGVGITLMPSVARGKKDGLVYIPFAPPAPSRCIALVWRKGSSRTKSITAAGEMMRKLVG